jgi:hypothetical protein
MVEPGRPQILDGNCNSFEDIMDLEMIGAYGCDCTGPNSLTYLTGSSFLPQIGPAELEINQFTRKEFQEGGFDALMNDSTFLATIENPTLNTGNGIAPNIVQSPSGIVLPLTSCQTRGTSSQLIDLQPTCSSTGWSTHKSAELCTLFSSRKDNIAEKMYQTPFALHISSIPCPSMTLSGKPSQKCVDFKQSP